MLSQQQQIAFVQFLRVLLQRAKQCNFLAAAGSHWAARCNFVVIGTATASSQGTWSITSNQDLALAGTTGQARRR